MTRPDPKQHRESIYFHVYALRRILELIPGGDDIAHMRNDALAALAVTLEQALSALAESTKTERNENV